MSRGLVNKSTGERIPSAPGYIVDKVGDLSALHTTAKDKAVSAINEVADAVSAIDDGASIDSFADVENALADKTDTDMVAADFNAGTSYTAGNYCVQDGKLYRFKNNHSGAWSASDVEEVKIAGELATLKSGLTNVVTKVAVTSTGKIRYTQNGDMVSVAGAVSGNGTSSVSVGIPEEYTGVVAVRDATNANLDLFYIGNGNLLGWNGVTNRIFEQDHSYQINGNLYKYDI